MDVIVRHDVAVVALDWLLAFNRFANANATSTEVRHIVADDFPTLTSTSEFESVPSEMRKRAVLDLDRFLCREIALENE